ncbi:MAG TPA: DedA family protein [Candidatus Saccharimonadales bacterium]|nr:DedA family protein [Candidatus Saccharimonadales bacterium]
MLSLLHVHPLLLAQLFNVTHLIQTGGLILIALIIFGESGMMIGFLFPGDTLLISAGVLAAGHHINLLHVIAVVAVAAIVGDNVGYQIGKSAGPHLFTRQDGFVFRRDHIHRAHRFFEKYGSWTMLLAHFVPIVRSFAPVVAGAADMPRKLFFVFDAIGDIAWAIIITLIGYFLGRQFPQVVNLIDPVLIGIIIIFLVPTLWHVLRDPKFRAAMKRRRQPKTGRSDDETTAP